MPHSVASKLAQFEHLYLPSPALAELYYGAYRSERAAQHEKQIEQFLEAADLLSPDQGTAKLYGQLAAELSRKGTLIPQNDIWIAALSIQCGLPLATQDQHFQHVPGLNFQLW